MHDVPSAVRSPAASHKNQYDCFAFEIVQANLFIAESVSYAKVRHLTANL
jgi:hypothetical protein